MQSNLPWTHRAVLSYYLERPGRPVDIRTVSAVISEGVQAVKQACADLEQDGLLMQLQPQDTAYPLFQLVAQEAGRARMMLATNVMLRKQG